MKFQNITISLFIFFGLFSCNSNDKYDQTSITHQNITEYIFAYGYTYPSDEENITSKSGGSVIEILVKEGQAIKKNAPVMKILTQSSKLPNPNLKSLIDKFQELPINSDISSHPNISSLGSINSFNTKEVIIRSKSEGIVFNINKNIGEYLNEGEVLMVIGNPNKISARLDVSEEDILKLKIGSSAKLKINAMKDKIFNGIISNISHKLTKNKTIQVIADIDNFNTTFYGLTVEGQILVRNNEKALCVPTDFLLNGDSLIIKDKKEIKKVKVHVGLKNEEFVEIRDSILKEGINIYKQKENGFNF